MNSTQRGEDLSPLIVKARDPSDSPLEDYKDETPDYNLTDQSNPSNTSYLWWIIIAIIVIVILVVVGVLIWWFTKSPDDKTNSGNPSNSQNKPTTNSGNNPINPINPSTNRPSQPIPNNPVVNPVNPPQPSNPSVNPDQSTKPPIPVPATRFTPAELGYPFLTSSSQLHDPFIPERNPWIIQADRVKAPYPFSFHLARLYMRIDGTKHYLQFNDPYKPDAWPDPGGDLFIWTKTPSQIDVFSSRYEKSNKWDGIRLVVYQHPTQQEPKPSNRGIYSGISKKGTNIHRLSTSQSNGIVILIMDKNNLLYLTAWTVTFNPDDTILSDDATLYYYVKNGYGRFMTLEDAAKENLGDYKAFPIGIENAPVDRKLYDS